MALDVVQRDPSSGTGAQIDTNGYQKVNTPMTMALAGYQTLITENDAGAITGSRELASPRTSDDYRLSVGMDTAIFDENFNATAQNTAIWKFFSLNSLIASQSGGYLAINPTQVVTSGGVVSMQTYRTIALNGNNTLHVEFAISIGTASTPLSGQVIEFGLFVPPATAVAPPDGIFFRYTSAGLTMVMVNNSGSETTIPTPRACANFTVDANYEVKMIIGERFADCYIDGVQFGSFDVPSGFGSPFLSGALPIGIIARNTGTISGTNGAYLKISDLHVDSLDMATGKAMPLIYSGMGRHGSQAQNGNTMGSTSNLTNNMALGTANALANATATAPGACIGLGGQATYLPTLTAITDGILQTFLNPAGSVNVQPRVLIIYGVWIRSCVTVVLANTGPVIQAYSLCYGHTNISLATSEVASFTTGGNKAARRIPLGFESFGINAAVGTVSADRVFVQFQVPIVINPGEYVQIAAKNLGTVTTSGQITSHIGFDSVWE